MKKSEQEYPNFKLNGKVALSRIIGHSFILFKGKMEFLSKGRMQVKGPMGLLLRGAQAVGKQMIKQGWGRMLRHSFAPARSDQLPARPDERTSVRTGVHPPKTDGPKKSQSWCTGPPSFYINHS